MMNQICWKTATLHLALRKMKKSGEHVTGTTRAVIAVIAIPQLTLKKQIFSESESWSTKYLFDIDYYSH